MSSVERKGAVILVVEDEPGLLELIKARLENEGFAVITAENGLDGLRRYEENKNEVQVVVTDLDMPAMSGSDMIRQIFKITPAMKVLVASGCYNQAQPQEPGPCVLCLPKPYTASELSDAVRSLL